jgi:hypothetical protein
LVQENWSDQLQKSMRYTNNPTGTKDRALHMNDPPSLKRGELRQDSAYMGIGATSGRGKSGSCRHVSWHSRLGKIA